MSRFYLAASSGCCISQQATVRSVERLQQTGHEVAYQQIILRWQWRFAGTERERLVDISQPTQLPECNHIALAVCGGYGVSRLLPHIDWQGLITHRRRDPLLIYGHSDFAAIQSDPPATGNIITFGEPIFAGNLGAETLDPFTEHHFWQALHQAEFTFEWSGEGPNRQVEGTLWGGNLVMLTSFIGTSWLPMIRGGILVVEDINGYPFRVERMLLQLLHSNMLAAQKAVISGSLTDNTSNDYDTGYDLPQVFGYLCQQLFLPLISGLELGHEQRMVTLPLGAHTRLVNQTATTALTISGHPVLTE